MSHTEPTQGDGNVPSKKTMPCKWMTRILWKKSYQEDHTRSYIYLFDMQPLVTTNSVSEKR